MQQTTQQPQQPHQGSGLSQVVGILSLILGIFMYLGPLQPVGPSPIPEILAHLTGTKLNSASSPAAYAGPREAPRPGLNEAPTSGVTAHLNGDGVALYSKPAQIATSLGGTSVQVIAGPVAVDGDLWVQVRFTTQPQVQGWCPASFLNQGQPVGIGETAQVTHDGIELYGDWQAIEWPSRTTMLVVHPHSIWIDGAQWQLVTDIGGAHVQGWCPTKSLNFDEVQ